MDSQPPPPSPEEFLSATPLGRARIVLPMACSLRALRAPSPFGSAAEWTLRARLAEAFLGCWAAAFGEERLDGCAAALGNPRELCRHASDSNLPDRAREPLAALLRAIAGTPEALRESPVPGGRRDPPFSERPRIRWRESFLERLVALARPVGSLLEALEPALADPAACARLGHFGADPFRMADFDPADPRVRGLRSALAEGSAVLAACPPSATACPSDGNREL